MTSLIGLLASAVATLTFYIAFIHGQPNPKNTPISQLCFIALYALTILLALRFAGRTYHGIYMPKSTVLNWVFNGSTLFAIGYALTLLGAGLHAAIVLQRGRPLRAFQLFSIGLIGLACSISAYGFVWAAVLHRLP